ncbi:hypothetical protein H0H93_000159 [Arthromyces matolae]|nr:hypothetical protein H0H93_000159 [Arthromyces matolae]
MHIVRRDSDSDVSISAGGITIKANSDSTGGGKSKVIKKGHTFQGRSQGGGTRAEIYGSHDYGSGYPGGGILRGTVGRGFPFYFWPVVWTNPFTIHAGDAYLHPTEYGLPQNVERPGGPLVVLTYISNTPSNSTFRVLADYASAQSLTKSLNACYPLTALTTPIPFPYLEYAKVPLPEQTLQYFRASSAALTLDGYNNTAALVPQDSSDSYSILLPADTDIDLLQCLNKTIGDSLLLYETPPGLSSYAIFFIVFGSLIGLLLLMPIFCSALRYCLRPLRRTTRDNPVGPIPPCMMDPIPVPPRALIAYPAYGRPSYSGQADLFDDDDEAALTKHAQPFAGALEDDTLPRKS